VTGGAGRAAVASPHRSPAAGITPRLADILAMMVEAALDAEDAGSAVGGNVTVASPTGARARPVPIGERRRETRKEKP
jgi:hypothetical protein